MASSTSTPAPSISRTLPATNQPNTNTFSPPATPAQLFYGARGRSGSIASSFAKQQVSTREHAQSPPIPPLPTSHSLPHHHYGHNHTSSIGSLARSSTFPALASPIRTTFPGSPVRSTFGEVLPPIIAGESFSFPRHVPTTITTSEPLSPLRSEPPSPSKPTHRGPSPLGHTYTHGHTPSLALPPSTRAYSPSLSHARSSSTVAEQIPLGRLPSKQSKEALLPGTRERTVPGKSPSSSPSFGAMFFGGKRGSMGFGAKTGVEGERTVEVVGIAPEKKSDEPEMSMERDKEKGWGDSVGGTRTPRESIVKFTRSRSRSHSGSEARSSGERALPLPSPIPQQVPRESGFTDGPRSQSRPSESSRPYVRRPTGTWQVDSGPVVKDKKTGRVIRRHELIESETRWFFRGWFVTGGGTRRVPAKERKPHPYIAGKHSDEADGDGWAYSDGMAYTYDGPQTGSSGPHTMASTNAGTTSKLNGTQGGKRTKRGRLSLIPYPFVFSVMLVLGTAAAWMGTTCVWWWRNESPAVAAIGAWLVLLVVVSMARTAFTDPGIVPRNLDLNPAMEDEHTPYARDLYVRGISVRVKYCMTCKTYRPLRSSHCRICDNCVDGCDHHCQWVNNCVGRRNYTAFITFLIACFLAILLMGVTAALHIYLQTLPRFGSNTVKGAMKSTGAGSAAVFVVCAAVVWPVGTLLGYHIRLLALNVTTIEQLRNSAHAALAPGNESSGPGPNAFSLGKWTRNAAWGACRPAGMSWVEGWKPVRADNRILLGADEAAV